MDDSIAMLGRRVHEDVGTTTQERQKQRLLAEKERKILQLPRCKACQGDTTCLGSAHMILTVAELERTLHIALEVLLDSCALHISSDMLNYLRFLVVDGHRTLIQVVKEELHAKYLSRGCKGIVNVCFSHSAYVSGIETPTGVHMTENNEVEVTDNDKRYMQEFLRRTLFMEAGNTDSSSPCRSPGQGIGME